MHRQRYRLVWSRADLLVAYEPTEAQVAHHAASLSRAYSESYNAAMMSNSGVMSPADVIEYYAGALRIGARPLLLERDGILAGDADLRHIDAGRGEAAILIAERAAQGQGLGTRFGIMLHAFAFRVVGLQVVHVAIIPENLASQRLFAKLGHTPDLTSEGRRFAEAESDLTLSVTREEFESRYPRELDEIQIECRPPE